MSVTLSKGEKRWNWRTWNLLLQIREATDGKDPRQRSGEMTERNLCVASGRPEMKALRARKWVECEKGGRDVSAVHAPDCAKVRLNGRPWYRCGGTYMCPRCDRTFGWCIGACDDTPALCDECANFIQELARRADTIAALRLQLERALVAHEK